MFLKTKTLILLLSLFFLSSCLWNKDKSNVLAEDQAQPDELVKIVYDHDKMAMSLEFNIEDETFFIETRRGEPLNSPDPDASEYAVDIFLMNGERALFLKVQGGDVPRDEKLERDIEENTVKYLQKLPMSPVKQTEIGWKALKIIKNIRFKEEFFPEHETLVELESTMESNLERDKKSEEKWKNELKKTGLTPQKLWKQKSTRMPKTKELSNSNEKKLQYISAYDLPLCCYTRTIEIRAKPLIAAILKDVAEHSAVIVYQENYPYSVTIITKNHGTLANHRSMNLKCSRTSHGEYVYRYALRCATPYFTHHVCNDDTLLQYWQFQNRKPVDIHGGTCADGNIRKWAPGCS